MHRPFPADALKFSGFQHDRPTVSKAVARWLSGSGDRNGGRAERLIRHRQRTVENVAPQPAIPPVRAREKSLRSSSCDVPRRQANSDVLICMYHRETPELLSQLCSSVSHGRVNTVQSGLFVRGLRPVNQLLAMSPSIDIFTDPIGKIKKEVLRYTSNAETIM